MLIRPLNEDLVFLCGIDRRTERFENLFDLSRGVSYNSFVVLDEKTVLFNAVDSSVASGFVDDVLRVLQGRPLDYLVVNHVEPDHIAGINEILHRFPASTLVVSKKGLEFLKQFFRREEYAADRVRVVADGDILDTGVHKLRFIAAPNVHWPEVTVCFDETSGWLFSADAFGSFGAPEGHLFADQVEYTSRWLSETRRYYSNIIGRFGSQMTSLLTKLEDLDITLICPLHGVLFRTPESVAYVIGRHRRWAASIPEQPGVVIVYGTLYHHAADLADEFALRLADAGVEHIRVHDASKSDFSHIVSDCFRFSNAVFIATTYNSELHPRVDALLRDLMSIGWDNRGVCVLGNLTWGGRGVKIAQEILSKAKNLTDIGSGFTIKGSLADEQLDELQGLVEAIAESLPER